MPDLPVRDPVLVFALLMLVLLVAPALAARARVPEVVGLIVAGALLGPSLLGVLDRSETITTLGTLGLLYLMFTAGLSLDLQQFNALRGRSALFGALSYTIPHFIAMGVALAFDMGLLAALLMGAICGTHTLVALPVAQRLGLGRHTAVTVTAGGTLVSDLLGLTVLAVVASVQEGAGGALFWVLFAAKLVLFVAAVLVLVPRVGRSVLRRMSLQPATELSFLLLVLFGTSYAASLAGLAPVVGAFLAGLTLNRMVPPQSGIMGRVSFVGNALFVPFFLVSVGMLIDVAALAQGALTWGLAAAFLGTICAGKLIAAWVTARALFGGFGAAGWVMFGLSTPQAAGTLAVTLVGFQIGLFDVQVVNAIVIIIVASCFLGSSVVDRAGRRAALEEEATGSRLTEEAPRILIPLANPHTAGALVDLAVVLRDVGSEDPIYPLTIVRDAADVHEQVAKSERLLAEAVLHAVAAGAPVQPTTRVDVNVVHGMVRAVKELRTTVVLIGWSGEASTGDRIFGGVLDQLLEQCPEMVLVCKIVAPPNTAERVLLLIPRHGPRLEGFDRAAHAAKSLARNVNATLLALAHADDCARVEERLGALRPQLPFTVEAYAQGEVDEGQVDLAAPLLGRVGPHDLLALVGARRETLAWGPSTARQPGRLSSAFPGNTLVVLHPAQAGGRPHVVDDDAPVDGERAAVVVRPTRTGRLFRPEPFEAFVARMLVPELGSRPEVLQELLQRLGESGAHEVKPGVVFVHAHAECWPEARLFVGESVEGLAVPGHEAPAETVVVVVSPWGQPPEVHLQNLAVVGRAALRLDRASFRAARTVAELETALRSASGPGTQRFTPSDAGRV